MNDVKLVFGPSRDVAVATNFVGKTRPKPHNCGLRGIRQGGVRQEVQLLRRVQADKLPNLMDAGEPIN